MFQLVNSGEDVLFVYYKEDRSIIINFNKGKHYRYLIDFILNKCVLEIKALESLLISKEGHMNYYTLCKYFYDNYRLKIINNSFLIQTHMDIAPLYEAMKKNIDDYPPKYEDYQTKNNLLLAISSDDEVVEMVETNDIFFIENFLDNIDHKRFYSSVRYLATHNI